MSHVIEVATLFLKAGVDIQDPSSPASQVVQETLSTISSQPGFQGLHHGLELEDTSILQLFIEWDRIESHRQFMNSPDYAPFSQRLGTILAKAPQLIHFVPKPFPHTVFGTAPVVEIATFFQTEDFFESNVQRFVTEVSPHVEGLVGFAYGPVVEEIAKEEGAVKGKAVMLWVGWESREAHTRFTKTEVFGKNIHYLREGMQGSEMHHVVLSTNK